MDCRSIFTPSAWAFCEIACVTGSMLSLNCGTPNHDSTNVIFTGAPFEGAVVGWAASVAAGAVVACGAEVAAGADVACGADVGADGAAAPQAASPTPAALIPMSLNISRRDNFFISNSLSESRIRLMCQFAHSDFSNTVG